MNIDLSGRIALITGSSKGIGLEIAIALGVAGAEVVICARHENELIQAQEKIKTLGITSSALSIDLTKEEAAKEMVNFVIQERGSLDILVNNVGGIPTTGRFEDLSDKDWYDCFTLNTMTTVRFCKEAVPFLRKSKYPRIINISSFVATQPGVYNPHYSACKASIVNLTKYLSNSLAKDGILVNCISPGIIHTVGWENYIQNKSIQENKSAQEIRTNEEIRVIEDVPLKRFGNTKEVASLVVFLASAASSFMIGDNIRVDGGKTRSI